MKSSNIQAYKHYPTGIHPNLLYIHAISGYLVISSISILFTNLWSILKRKMACHQHPDLTEKTKKFEKRTKNKRRINNKFINNVRFFWGRRESTQILELQIVEQIPIKQALTFKLAPFGWSKMLDSSWHHRNCGK